MTPIRVNGDFEEVLFHQKSSEALAWPIESLALFLEKRPLVSSQHFPKEFLTYVQEVTGRTARIIRAGPGENWWGSLEDSHAERAANSKVTSAELVIRKGWCPETKILLRPTGAPSGRYLLKACGGMSGRGIWNLDFGPAPASLKGPCVLEPLFERKHDFSHFRFPSGKLVCYQNFVDRRFQYRGTIFARGASASVSDLLFYSELAPLEWQVFQDRLAQIIDEYLKFPLAFGFSMDSFSYFAEGEQKIRTLSEVNHRRTMGSCTHDLAWALGDETSTFGILLGKGLRNFSKVRTRVEHLLLRSPKDQGIVILSPGQRFELFYFQAPEVAAARDLLQELAVSLPEAELSIDF